MLENIIVGVILGIFSISLFVLSTLSFCQRGFLFNNAYLYASKEERTSMDKAPYYRQSGIVFALLGVIFAVLMLDGLLETSFLFWIVIGLMATVIAYVVISSVIIEKTKKPIQ